MKSFKKFVAEVAQPESEEEKRFKDQHTYEVIKHPVATDAQFTGEVKKDTTRKADQSGDANYDKALKNPEKRMVPESVEEVEQLDELSPKTLKSYVKKADKDAVKSFNKATDHEDDSDSTKHDKLFDRGMKRADGATKAREKLAAKGHKPPKYPNESVEEGIMDKVHNIRRKVLGKSDAEKRAEQERSAMAGFHKAMNKAADGMTKKKKNEEVEQIDEISKELAGRYIKQAQVDSADAGMDTASQDKDIRKRGINKFLKRRKGVDAAVKRLMKRDEELSPKQKKIDANKNGKIDGHDLAVLRAKKKNEEVELDETTSSAMKKMVTQTGPDGKTRTVMKKAKADKTDDRGQDQIDTRESVELEEAVKVKRGPLRLKDGSQIMVSKQDAELLSRMFSDLSPNNQRQMEKVMMMDKAGFEEIRGFAREAL